MEGLVNFSIAGPRITDHHAHVFFDILERRPGTHQYVLALHPATDVCDQVMLEKQNFSATYREKVPRSMQVHIELADFLADEAMEETIIRYMRRIFSRHGRFNVVLNNYSGVPEHSVFVRVQDYQPFEELAASLKVIDQYLQSSGWPPAQLIAHPHLLIASGLQREVYKQAVFEYSQKTFHASFDANELILMKRESPLDQYRRVNVFALL